MKSWYMRTEDLELKDGSTVKNYHYVFDTTDKMLAKEVESLLTNIMDRQPQTEYDKGLKLFADILFDKEKSEQFLKECKTMGIEPLKEKDE